MNEMFRIAESMIDRAAANMPGCRMAKNFAAWGLGRGDGCDREDLDAETLEQAADLRTPPIMPVGLIPKGGFPAFVILETDDTARDGKPRQVLHFYIIKTKRGYRSYGPFGGAQMVGIPHAVHAGSLAMDAFQPRRAFSALRGDDPVTGRQPTEQPTIEIRS